MGFWRLCSQYSLWCGNKTSALARTHLQLLEWNQEIDRIQKKLDGWFMILVNIVICFVNFHSMYLLLLLKIGFPWRKYFLTHTHTRNAVKMIEMDEKKTANSGGKTRYYTITTTLLYFFFLSLFMVESPGSNIYL